MLLQFRSDVFAHMLDAASAQSEVPTPLEDDIQAFDDWVNLLFTYVALIATFLSSD